MKEEPKWRLSGSYLRSFLFIPAINPRMLGKINVLKPDVFILDLEDSVPLQQKQEARRNISVQLAEIQTGAKLPPIYVRINDLDTAYPLDDIKETFHTRINGFMIPKFESSAKMADIERAVTLLEKQLNRCAGETRLILQIESMKGLRELFNIDHSSILSRLVAFALGGEDFVSTLSSFSEIDSDMLSFARKMLVFHAKSYGVAAIDTIYRNFRDIEGLKKESDSVVRMGFDGKLAVHPEQVSVINACFSPSKQDLERVKNIIANMAQIEQKGAIDVNGIMFDRAHLKWALKVQEFWLK